MAETGENLITLPELVLDWYRHHARNLPWRTGPIERAKGARPDPYHVWLSEIMLQQTGTAQAAPYFHAFTARWPDITALAAARDEDVMAAWAGLGYYARARNLLACVRKVSPAGKFPQTVPQLRALPGIGPYTAGAMAAIAFDQPAAAVDGNVLRIFARLLALKGDWKAGQRRIKTVVGALVPVDKPGEFAEALMDIGATVCTPRAPRCQACPLSDLCCARLEGDPQNYPIKPGKRARPVRHGSVFVIQAGNEILLERRPARGLLGGMLGLPTTIWDEKETAEPDFPFYGDWHKASHIRHVFTHFTLELDVWHMEFHRDRPGGLWTDRTKVAGLPSVFAKALEHFKS